MYPIHEFCPERKMLSSFVLIRGKSVKKEVIWVAKILQLFRRFVKENTESAELAFVQCVRGVQLLDAKDEALGCVYLQLVTADYEKDENDLKRFAEENIPTLAEKGFKFDSSQSNPTTGHAFRKSMAVHAFVKKLLWTCHRVSSISHLPDSAMRKQTVHD